MSLAISSCRSLRAAWPTSLNASHRVQSPRVTTPATGTPGGGFFFASRIQEGHHGKPQAVSRHPARTHPGLPRLLCALGVGFPLHQDRLRTLWHPRARWRLTAALCRFALYACRCPGYRWDERSPAPSTRSTGSRHQAHLCLVALPDYRAVLLFLPGTLARQCHVELHHRGQRQLPSHPLCRPGVSHRKARCGQGAWLCVGLCRRRARQPFGRGRHLWLYARRRGLYLGFHCCRRPIDLSHWHLLARA